MTWTTLMPGVYAGVPVGADLGVRPDLRVRPTPAEVRTRQRAHVAARRRELLASEIPQIAPGEHWCCCCGESCGEDGQCERCGRDCPRCDGHYTVLAIAVLKPAEYALIPGVHS